jgi:hypothetical protein
MRATCLGLTLAAIYCSGTLSPDCSRAQSAASEEIIQINDQLTNIDPLDRATNYHHKVHVFKLQSGKTYQAILTRKDDKQFFPLYLRVEDSAGKELLAQFNNQRVRVKFTAPKDETSRLIVSSGGGVGEYLLKVAPAVPILVLKNYEPAKAIDIAKGGGFEHANKLTDKDPRDRVRQQMFAKIFLVNMVKDRVYTIDMMSRQFDAFLRLEDSAGKQLAEDDDSGGNLDALVIFRAPATGTYRIITTSFAGNTQGDFLLRVQED